jgi:hypothetical protein
MAIIPYIPIHHSQLWSRTITLHNKHDSSLMLTWYTKQYAPLSSRSQAVWEACNL